MNPLRKRFWGDAVTSQIFTKHAMNLMGALKDQMRLGGLKQLTMRRTLPNGVELTAISKFDQDEIRVDSANITAKGNEEITAQFCVWEGDSELFTAPMRGTHITGPTMFSAESFYMGGNITTELVPLPVQHTESTFGKRRFLSADMSVVEDTALLPFAGDGELTDDKDFVVIYADAATQEIYGKDVGGGQQAAHNTASALLFGSYGAGEAFPDRFLVRSTSTGGITADIDRRGVFDEVAVHRKNGDVYVALRTIGSGFPHATPSRIERYGVASEGAEMFSMPEGVDAMDVLIEFRCVVTNSGDIWLCYRQNVNTSTPWRVFRLPATVGEIDAEKDVNQDNWIEVTVEGGFGSATEAGMRFNNTNEPRSPLMHDPITDAVCMVVVDQALDIGVSVSLEIRGAWIFNARDCLNRVMAPFFRPFVNVPVEATTPTEYALGVTSLAETSQFYNGRIYMKYMYLDTDPNESSVYYWNNVGAAYKVGRILQKKR